nr:(r)-mandelonitrile lyase-like [Quercus suber]
MLIAVSQTHVSSNGSAHVIKNEDVDLPCIHVGGQISLLSGYHITKELDSSFLGDKCAINDRFHSRDDYNLYKKLSSTSTYGILNTQECALGSSNALLARFYSQDYHNFIRNRVLSQGLYVPGSKISSSTFDCTRKRYGAADLLKCARPFNIKVDMDRYVKRKLLASPVYMESRLSTIGVINCGLWKIGEKILYAGTNVNNVRFSLLGGLGGDFQSSTSTTNSPMDSNKLEAEEKPISMTPKLACYASGSPH